MNLEDRQIRDPLSLHDRVVLHAETTQEVLAPIEKCRALRDWQNRSGPQAISARGEAERAAAEARGYAAAAA
jgi:hypothetical protein